MLRRNSSQINVVSRKPKRVRKLAFDCLEPRRLFAGLQVFVYNDLDESGTANTPDEVGMNRQVAYLDSNKDGTLNSNEQFQLTDAEGLANFTSIPSGVLSFRVLGAVQSFYIDTSNPAAPSKISLAGNQVGENNPPQFSGELTDAELTENGDLELAIDLLTSIASDQDGDGIWFFVTTPPSHGTIDWSSSAGGTYHPSKGYSGVDTIAFSAFDGRSWSSPIELTIKISDVDTPPSDLTTNFVASIPENSPGFVIGPVTVVDPDGGANQLEISGDERLELVNGVVQVKAGAIIDFEQNSPISFVVSVSSGGSSGQPIVKQFTIPVDNRNDLPTGMIFNGVNLVGEYVRGFTFGKFAVIDPDQGDLYNFSVDDARFQINDGNLALKSDVYLERTASTFVTVNVTASSQSSEGQIKQAFTAEIVQSSPPWQNKSWALDVNNDGALTSLDVLLVINALNRTGAIPLDVPPSSGSTAYVDVNGDRHLTPLDALILINVLNRMSSGSNGGGTPDSSGSPTSGSAEGEGTPTPPPPTSPSNSMSSLVGSTSTSSNMSSVDWSLDETTPNSTSRSASRRLK